MIPRIFSLITGGDERSPGRACGLVRAREQGKDTLDAAMMDGVMYLIVRSSGFSQRRYSASEKHGERRHSTLQRTLKRR